MRTGKSLSGRAVLPPSVVETVSSPYIRQGRAHTKNVEESGGLEEGTGAGHGEPSDLCGNSEVVTEILDWHRARGSEGGAWLTSHTPEKGPGLGRTSRQKIGGHEPVGLGIGPQLRCIAMLLSAAEHSFRGAVEAKTSLTVETEVSAACVSTGDSRCDPAEERRMRTGESHSGRAVLLPSGAETVSSLYIRRG
ncbi:hypothetical protein NDU88_002717 [Pleurodeles waltl]|uniref:Uncharacterized protein n=1 Tax=Pleurodeles waltl TaxID=8319 RepID=A0AAV7QAS2_PLEWA|nr:hypothetical protein NDU88_002717 [Pleurodeles waltl]